MDEQRIDILSRKIVDGSITANELKEYNEWFRTYDEVDYHVKSEVSAEELKTRMYVNIAKAADFELLKTKPLKLWPRIAAVAAAVALIVLGVYFFNYRSSTDTSSALAPALAINDIAPGKNGATLTLANGKVIQLSDAKSGVVIGDDKLAYNDGSSVGRHPELVSGSRTREATMTAKTTRGQTYIFTLPDGTKVWLNAASSLTIPSGFSGTESRIVELSGEAYFEVATSYTSLRGRRTKQSFVVKTAGNNGRPGQEVMVLGTHFNINSYADEGNIKTTLLEGSVRIAKTTPPTAPLLAKEGTVILKPGQQSVVTGSDRIQVKEIDPAEAVAWKNGEFMSDSEPLESVMRKISRWYDIEVIYEKESLKNIVFNGSMSRYESVSRILKTIEFTGNVKFKVEGRKVYVLP